MEIDAAPPMREAREVALAMGAAVAGGWAKWSEAAPGGAELFGRRLAQ